MRTLLLTLHVVAAIFIVGPLVAVANGAAREARGSDARGLTGAARLLSRYGWASLLVLVFGAALVRRDWGTTFGTGWLIASVLMFVIAVGLVLGVLVPMLRRAAALAQGGGSTAGLAGRLAAVGGVASLLLVAIAVLMVWQPGA